MQSLQTAGPLCRFFLSTPCQVAFCRQTRRLHSLHLPSNLFSQPFYYIEYAIAQIGALQAWLFERRDHAGAVEAYRAALALGGSRPLPELFETAGLEFGMDRSILGRLIPALMERIRELS